MGMRAAAAGLLKRAGTILSPPADWPGWPVGWGTDWSMTASPRALENASVVFACVDRTASALASMPLAETKDDAPVPDPAAWLTNPNPARYAHIGDAVTEIVWSLLLRGNAYLYPTDTLADGYPMLWTVLDPDRAVVETGEDGRQRLAFPDYPSIAPERIVHIRHMARPGHLLGVSPLDAAASSLGVSSALERHAHTLATAGGIPSGVLSAQTDITADTALRYKEAFQNREPGEVLVLGAGLEYSTLSLSPEDMALLGLREFDGRAIASVFGVPAWMVGLPQAGDLTYNSPAMAMDYFWRSTLRPISVNIGRALATMRPGRRTIAFDADAYTRPPHSERVAAGVAGTGAGLFTVNEWRAEENLPPLLGGDAPAPLIPLPGEVTA